MDFDTTLFEPPEEEPKPPSPMVTIGGVTFDLKLTFLIIFGTFVPMLDYYNHQITSIKAYDRFILYFVLPVLIIKFLTKDSLQEHGVQWGRWGVGLGWTAVSCLVLAFILYPLAQTPAMQTYYQRLAGDNSIVGIVWLAGVDLFGWEFIWRGWMLFTFARHFGPGPAIFLQAVPFAFMHLGKPEVETLTTIFGGAGFGFVAWQSKSFIYPFLIHWFILAFTMLVAIGFF